MIEIWKNIEEYEEYYQVSNLGRIKSKKRKVYYTNGRVGCCRERLLKFYFFNEYPCVGLSKNGKRKSFRVHRLVAKAFIPNPENKPQVNHKNSIKGDSRLENLEWVTASENIRHCINNGRFKSRKEDRSFIKDLVKKHAKQIKMLYN